MSKGNTERQDRLEQLVEEGYTPGEAAGRVRAEEAGYEPLKSAVADEAATIGRPTWKGPKRAA
jgi:hypothetical protein